MTADRQRKRQTDRQRDPKYTTALCSTATCTKEHIYMIFIKRKRHSQAI